VEKQLKLKIGIIAPVNVFPPTFGGAVRIYQIAKNLGELGCSVHLFAPEGGGSFELLRNVKVYQSRELNNIEEHYPIDIPGIHTLSRSLARLIKRLGCYKCVDIIQSQHLLTALQGLALKNLLNKPAILSEHNVETLVWYQINRVKRQRWKKLRLLERFACKSFDHILAQSIFDKRMIQTLFSIDPFKVTVIPNGVDTQYFSPKRDDRERIRLKYRLSDEPVVLFSGRLSWFPNADALKMIFLKIYPTLKELMPEAVFMVVGTNPPSWLTNRKGKDLIVTQTEHYDVASYINAADVCIAPLRFGSGMCLKTLEYMSCGKPVVSTSSGARGLHVIDQRHMIIEDNITSFAKQIAHLFKNKPLATRLGKEARNLVENTYDWKIITKKLIEVYERLLTSKR